MDKKRYIVLQESVELVPSPPAEEFEPEPDFESEVEGGFSPAELEVRLILQSLQRLQRRGTGEAAWTTSLEEEPLTFLLDAVSDAWIVRHSSGNVIFANKAARELRLETREFCRFERFTVEERSYEKRGLSYAGLMLEVATRREVK